MNIKPGSDTIPTLSSSYHFSYPQAFTQTSSAYWIQQHPTLASSSQIIQPQKIQNLSGPFQASESRLPQQENVVKECTRRNSRRTKNKRLRNSKKELESAKKNSQSNIINQLYSFFNSYEKSENVVQGAIKLLKKQAIHVDRIKTIFYNIIRLINYKRGRNYVNKESILSYYAPERFVKMIPDIEQKLEQVQLLTLKELCALFRTVTAYYLRNISISAIITSKRITNIAKNEHLKRRRKILSCLKQKNDD